MKQKVGFLLPRSDMYPALASDFMKGVKLPLNGHDIREQFDFVIEGIGTASDETVIKTTEKLLLQEDVDIVFAFCSNTLLEKLIKVFDAYKRPLVHIDLGGNYLQKKHCSDFVAHQTLNLFQAAYAAGQYAAANYGKNAMVSSSFYDGGYHIHIGFEKGFKDAGGSDVSYFVSPQNYKEQSYEHVLKRINEEKPDVIFGLYSFNEGNNFFEFLASNGITKRIPFLTTPIMTDESFVKKNYGLENVLSIASWSFDDEDSTMKSWTRNFVATYGEQPGIFALLGFESRVILEKCMEVNQAIPAAIGLFLQDQHLSTPRGEIGFNSFGESQPEKFKLRKFEYNQVQYHNKVVDTIENKNSVTLNQHFEGQPFSGWTNPYICT